VSDELKPCPFCGGGTTQFVENGRVSSGMKYTDPISVSVQHWCDPVPGQPSRGIERVGRDKASAITLWNTRADDTLRTQLAAMTAGRDALQTSMNELRKTCAEIIGADPQTWPDHGNAPLAIAACLGLRDAELQKTTAERDAALAKVAVLRDQMEKFDQWSQAYPTDVFPELDLPLAHELLKAGGMSLDRLSAGAMRHTISRVGELARNALEATK